LPDDLDSSGRRAGRLLGWSLAAVRPAAVPSAWSEPAGLTAVFESPLAGRRNQRSGCVVSATAGDRIGSALFRSLAFGTFGSAAWRLRSLAGPRVWRILVDVGKRVSTVTDEADEAKAEIPAGVVGYLIATAARAPSILNTQPWRFEVGQHRIELYADFDRKLRVDLIGRELVISCGAALFGLRLAIRSLGYLPVVELLPDPSRPRLLASVTLGAAQAPTAADRRMLEALPHRHTHRGPFDAAPLPAGLLAGLQHDAQAEGATLALVDRAHGYEKLADIMDAVSRRQDSDPRSWADMVQWTRDTTTAAHDGVPAHTFTAGADRHRGTLPQRDFDLGRGLGELAADGPPPAATAVLLTPGDARADWLCAGQALHRVLADAASRWVFASIHTRPLEAEGVRALIRDRLVLSGAPQLILQLGVARATQVTARRPPSDLLEG